MSRCKACNKILDLTTREGFVTDLCGKCNTKSYDGKLYDPITGEFSGFSPPEYMSRKLGSVFTDSELRQELYLRGYLNTEG